MFCSEVQFLGYMVDGSFQQYVVVNVLYVVKFFKDKGVELDVVVFILCVGLMVYIGFKQSEVWLGQYVVIVGVGGGLGSLVIQYVKVMGLYVIVIDGGLEKGESCKKLGVEVYVDYLKSKDLVVDVKVVMVDGLGLYGVLLLVLMEKLF